MNAVAEVAAFGSAEVRARRLLRLLTPDEKLLLLHQSQPPIRRLGLAAFRTGQEAAHGVAWSGTATVFPQPIGLAASWNPELLRAVGTAVGEQARRFHHGERPEVGLNLWAPVVDLLRDPRAGRNEEGLSEDPHLTGVLSTAYCRGLAGSDPERWRTAPTLKHFLAYNNETRRVTTSADVRPRLLHEYYLRAFEPAIRSGAAKAVMLSYNLVNGRPCHLSPAVRTALRRWNPDLVVVSDAYGPSNLAAEQAYLPDHAVAHAAALRAGLDSFTDQGPDARFTLATLREALRRGLITAAEIDRAVLRLLRMRTHLDGRVPAGPSGWQDELARRAVRESIVLLRNHALLPLDQERDRSVAVLGPLSNQVLQDWYSGTPPYRSTPLAAVAERVDRVRTATGHDRVRIALGGAHPHEGEYELQDWGDGLVVFRAPDGRFLTRKRNGELVAEAEQPNGWVVQETFRLIRPDDADPAAEGPAAEGPAAEDPAPIALEHVATGERYPVLEFGALADGVAEAVAAASACDLTILVLGNHPLVGARETTDRTHLDLPDSQRRLLHAVSEANPRTVLVVQSGFPYALGEFETTVPAILWLAHGGQETGRGLADVLFGAVSPAGRLPQGWYGSSRDLASIGPIDGYDIIDGERTYLYQTRPALYPFGHGLSYTSFGYSPPRIETAPDGTRRIAVDVTNTGDRSGAEVVQFYARRVSPSRLRYPTRKLIGFRKLELTPGETRSASLELDPVAAFAIWDVRQGRFLVEAGQYAVEAAASSTDVRQTLFLRPDGETLSPRAAGTPIRAADFDAHDRTRLLPDRPLSGDVVAAADGSGWIDLHDIDFGPVSGSSAVLVVRGSGPGCLRVLTGPERAPLATVRLPDESEQVIRTRCAPPSTIADIRIVLEGSARLAEFWFEGSRPS